jgi:hypothetical protein
MRTELPSRAGTMTCFAWKASIDSFHDAQFGSAAD